MSKAKQPTIQDAIQWHKRGKQVSPSAFSVLCTEELLKEITRLNTIIDDALEYIEDSQRFNGLTVHAAKQVHTILQRRDEVVYADRANA